MQERDSTFATNPKVFVLLTAGKGEAVEDVFLVVLERGGKGFVGPVVGAGRWFALGLNPRRKLVGTKNHSCQLGGLKWGEILIGRVELFLVAVVCLDLA